MKTKIEIIKDDITKQNVDAIVYAANTSLLGGGGVDGAIHRAAGPELLKYNKKLGGCPTGDVKLAPGFNLPAKFVIHTVGPIWNSGEKNEDKLLANCYKNSLLLAVQKNFKSIAFPSISTGVYGFPLERAVNIALTETKKFLSENDELERILFVCFDERTKDVYVENYKRIFNT